MNKLAAVVVLYNPSEDVYENVNSYVKDIDQLYIVDNSNTHNMNLVNSIKTKGVVNYKCFGENLGIAKALNYACEQAISDGYEWLLTMDQDSKASDDMLDHMLNYKNTHQMNGIAIISPIHGDKFHDLLDNIEKYEEILTTMTSGNLVNLKAYSIIGSFNEEFFIDYVDHEYCLRSNLKGYKVVQVNHAKLEHNLGNITQHKLFGKHVYTTNHNHIRRYYVTRNRLYTINMYKSTFSEFTHHETRSFIMETLKIVLLEKNKIKKAKAILYGVVDYKKQVKGKLSKKL